MRGASADPITALKSGERGIAGHRERFSVQRVMVVTQIAVSMVLLVGALLFVRSYRNLITLDPGMRESGITIGYFGFRRSTSSRKMKPSSNASWLKIVRSVPGVQNAAAPPTSRSAEAAGATACMSARSKARAVHLCRPALLRHHGHSCAHRAQLY